MRTHEFRFADFVGAAAALATDEGPLPAVVAGIDLWGNLTFATPGGPVSVPLMSLVVEPTAQPTPQPQPQPAEASDGWRYR